jgi:uncharacterized membrane protein
MEAGNEKMNQLLEKLELLLKRQDDFSKEINHLKQEINSLRPMSEQAQMIQPEPLPQPERILEQNAEPVPARPQQAVHTPSRHTAPPAVRSPKEKSNLEKFIGENLINKIGIAITVIGVAIGVKYSIDRDLISPLTRIILGYLMGVGLLGFGYRLKAKYENFSAVLVSGAMAILYVLLLLANSFLFFGIGYATLDSHPTGKNLLGLFTLSNALIHFLVAVVIYRHKLADRNLLYLVSGLVLIFITIAIPVQLDGNWVTLLWAGEAALLFWIGRTKNAPVYETLSYPLMALASFSILHDWETLYGIYNPENPETRITPLLNVNFLSSLLFTGAFGFINYIHQKKEYLTESAPQKGFYSLMSLVIPTIFIAAIYFTFRVEISNYWTQLYRDSAVPITEEDYSYQQWNPDYNWFKSVWIINYSLLFFSALSFINIRKIKNELLGAVTLSLNLLTILVFLVAGLYALSELRESYLGKPFSEQHPAGFFNIGIRYVSFVFFGLAWAACIQYVRQDFIRQNLRVVFEILLCISMVWVASSELIHWMDMAHSTQSYKLGLSILWGISSLLLIAVGIWKKKKHWRIGAIVLFGLTLMKLFFYDISHLDTISKTIVLVSLGVLLLIISFLYTKYKNLIFEDS